MDKSSSQIGVTPLTKISPVTAVASIGNPAQALESRADHLAKQHAALVAKHAGPETSVLPEKTTSMTSVSDTARLIAQLVRQAEANGGANKFISQIRVTNHPQNPEVVAQQLKAAISNSGLFYESHLRKFIDGHRNLAAIKQEPQNQFQPLAQSLLPQQLSILEHQRLSWHGEVWPNQQMDWDIYLHNRQENAESNFPQPAEKQAPITSDLTLNLPRLGKVTAKISFKDGRIQVGLLAEEKATLQKLKERSPALARAVESRGQILESLTVNNLDGTVQDG